MTRTWFIVILIGEQGASQMYGTAPLNAGIVLTTYFHNLHSGHSRDLDWHADMSTSEVGAFFTQPILNSPYTKPTRHWELDRSGQPTHRIIETRRAADFITPIPKPKKRRTADVLEMDFEDETGVATADQQYDTRSLINEIRGLVDEWRMIANPALWRVTPETARLLQHWRHSGVLSVSI